MVHTNGTSAGAIASKHQRFTFLPAAEPPCHLVCERALIFCIPSACLLAEIINGSWLTHVYLLVNNCFFGMPVDLARARSYTLQVSSEDVASSNHVLVGGDLASLPHLERQTMSRGKQTPTNYKHKSGAMLMRCCERSESICTRFSHASRPSHHHLLDDPAASSNRTTAVAFGLMPVLGPALVLGVAC